MFGKSNNKKLKWKAEYNDRLYKIYDWDGNLAGYFFPHYNAEAKQEDNTDDEAIEDLTKMYRDVPEATLLLPMVKLDIFDNHSGMEIDEIISSLDLSRQRIDIWKNWLLNNAKIFAIAKRAVFTAREDRNMLSIALEIAATIPLGEKQVRGYLSPLLDKLHEDGLL